ncbi:hypothetical protein HII36_27280 [Nonomuraea sp. NN258]|uniref:M14 family zinc carboxypeptidase n=1 Tax=Nonomuraea antri TaxID=2730852 RepID=UPI00156835CD|nr:M14 family zinc carboxypeptidase [Nonomuraea antri]NRQ35505.1 hypothetical protein [Nonomuraea antri]
MSGGLRELCRRHPALCSIRPIGRSRAGEPLDLVSIGGDGGGGGGGARGHALVVGGPHANEPAGLLTVLRLATLLCADPARRAGLTWHFIGCLDPDGARLNEGWYGGPYTVAHHHRHFYRPAMGRQPEWTFPIETGPRRFDRPLPETLALRRVIDELRPVFMCSLHNADFGGAYFQVSRRVPGLAAELAAIAESHGVPLDLAPIDTVGYASAGPGVSLLPSADRIDFAETAEQAGAPRPYGASSWQYADRYGTFTLIAEVPLWVSPGCDDRSPAGLTRGQLVKSAAVRLREEIEPLAWLRAETRTRCVADTPFHAAVDDTLAVSRLLVASLELGVDQREPVSRAEAGGINDTVRRMPLRAAAMFARLLAAEPELATARAEVGGRLRRLCAAAQAEVVQLEDPIGRITAIQTHAVLTAARRCLDR